MVGTLRFCPPYGLTGPFISIRCKHFRQITLREKADFVEPIQQIHPTGKSPKSLSSPFRKNILVFRNSKSVYMHLIPSHPEGRCATSSARGGDAVDVDGAPDEGA
jgi:hypothetical protein